MGKQPDLLQGTLEMLVLKAISRESLHGYGILLRIQQLSQERLQIQQGSLYPALYRLEYRGLIKSEWGESDNKRKAKYYRLTADGRKQLRVETENWNRLSAGVLGVMNAAEES
jgi:PadR family transcriptional regulator PadR